MYICCIYACNQIMYYSKEIKNPGFTTAWHNPGLEDARNIPRILVCPDQPRNAGKIIIIPGPESGPIQSFCFSGMSPEIFQVIITFTFYLIEVIISFTPFHYLFHFMLNLQNITLYEFIFLILYI